MDEQTMTTTPTARPLLRYGQLKISTLFLFTTLITKCRHL